MTGDLGRQKKKKETLALDVGEGRKKGQPLGREITLDL